MVYECFLAQGVKLEKFGANKGAWAVITGASDGIGKEFALQLASRGFHILLISRTKSKLEALAKEIEQKYKKSTAVIAMDFSTAQEADYRNIETMIQEMTVGVLVNNVGTNHDIPTPFAEESLDVVDSIVKVNIGTTLRMTKMVLPGMMKRHTGLILNVGSFAGLVPTPYLSVYSGSKGFLSTWSQAFGAELESSGIVLENVCTYFVVSNMSKIRRPSPFIPLPSVYVKQVLSKIGLRCGSSFHSTSTPFFTHALMNWVIEHFGNARIWLRQSYQIQSSIRKRALRKKQRETKAQ